MLIMMQFYIASPSAGRPAVQRTPAAADAWTCYRLDEFSVSQLVGQVASSLGHAVLTRASVGDLSFWTAQHAQPSSLNALAIASIDHDLPLDERTRLEEAGFLVVDDVPADVMEAGNESLVFFLRGRLAPLTLRPAPRVELSSGAPFRTPRETLGDEERQRLLRFLNAEDPSSISD
jgi:hypothetical protein